jgi:hypothetical protein
MTMDRPTEPRRCPSAATAFATLALLSTLLPAGAGCEQGSAAPGSARQSPIGPNLEARLKAVRNAKERHALLQKRFVADQDWAAAKQQAGPRKQKKRR